MRSTACVEEIFIVLKIVIHGKMRYTYKINKIFFIRDIAKQMCVH